MANIAQCAICIAKADLPKLNGALRKASPGEKSYTCYKGICKDKSGNVHTIMDEYLDGWGNNSLILDGKKITHEEFVNKHFVGIEWETVADEVVDEGWFLDWKKLHGFSYQSDTWIQEYPEFIRVDFGGRWDFPADLEEYLYDSGVEWQGAALDDAMDWQTTELGNSDFGLIIVQDEEPFDEDENGNKFYGHHIEIKQEDK